MEPATMLHIADVHIGLGGRAFGYEGIEARTLASAVDLARDAAVDLLLIAGDLFDHPRVCDDTLAWTATELDRAGCPVVLLVGNHDTLHDTSVHHRFRAPERCDQVQLLDDVDGSIVEVPGTDLVVWGRAMVEHTRSFRPLVGVPQKPEGKWGVVAGHGLVQDEGQRRHHASPITESDLDAIDWDYVALGHHHGHKVVRSEPAPVVYPGLTVRSRKGEPGAVLVHFEPGEAARVEWTGLEPAALRPA